MALSALQSSPSSTPSDDGGVKQDTTLLWSDLKKDKTKHTTRSTRRTAPSRHITGSNSTRAAGAVFLAVYSSGVALCTYKRDRGELIEQFSPRKRYIHAYFSSRLFSLEGNSELISRSVPGQIRDARARAHLRDAHRGHLKAHRSSHILGPRFVLLPG